MKSIIPFAFTMLFIASCNLTLENNKFSDDTIVEIYDLKDKRDTQSLLPFLSNENAQYRKEAALAFGSVQDTLALPKLHDLLEDSDQQVRAVAAFALGQTRNKSSQIPIQVQLAKEEIASVKYELLIAYGKCLDSLGLPYLVDFVANSDLARRGKAWGLYLAGLKNIWSLNGTKQSLELLKSPDPETQLAASNYFSRIRIDHIAAYENTLVDLFQKSKDLLVRMNLAGAIGKIGTETSQVTLINAIGTEQNHLVVVNIIRALNEKFESKYIERLKNLSVNGTSQVAITAADKLAKSTLLNAEQVVSMIDQSNNSRVHAILYNILIKLKGQSVSKTIKEKMELSNNIVFKGGLLSVLSNDTTQVDYIANATFTTSESYLKTAGINALQNLMNNGYSNKAKMARYFKTAILSQDIGLIYGATQALSDTTNGLKSQYENFDFLYEAKKSLTLPIDAEAMIAVQNVIDLYERTESSTTFENPYNNPIDWERVKSIPKNQQVILHTEKGDITWQLNIEEAPGTTAFFLKLVNEGFYNGLTFHRVIPNFVAQGGCPRGDGFGSTQESIRSEFGLTRYKTGSVGVASAGKDTESCQFFMTHSPTPHLNGRYTIFAEVIDGMELAQMLDIGDKINSIEIL